MKEQEDNTIDEQAIKVRKPRKKKEPGEAKPKTPKAPKVPKTLREVFTERITSMSLDEIKKPWMSTKSFRLLDTEEAVREWVNTILNDPSRVRQVPCRPGWSGPVIAVDTETDGLDIRVVNGKLKVTLAGVCLSADGLEGVYIPVGHEGCRNVQKTVLAPILQDLFDRSHLIFFNAKFDREILRLLLGIVFKDYPSYEDVQVLNYLDDPKAKLDDKGAGGLQFGGLKMLAKEKLGIEQIELDTLTKVKATVWNTVLNKNTQRMVYAPFTWVPTDFALWYAAGDAITTWMLWDHIHSVQKFETMMGVHRMDHMLIDTLTWIERQRIRLDSQRLTKTITFHDSRVKELTAELAKIAGVENFNPGSTPQLRKILFEDRNMEVIETSDKSGDASTAIGVLKELKKRYPEDEFLTKLMDFREYAALHPGNISYDPVDQTARMYFKQNVVAGGRLAAAGGEWDKDGGCGINPQAIKKVGGNWWVKGKPIPADEVVEAQFDASNLDPSCFDKDMKKAPNIEGNHVGTYFGERYCMVPGCTAHTAKAIKVDANEVINLRGMFMADPGWTIFSIDYSNIEMRVAANISKEPAFIREFLEGSGDFHTLTALALFPEYSDPEVPKARKKELRSLAKIINFALLYGGTSHTIFENLNKAGFNISKEEAAELVQKYWDSVPTFAAWCLGKRDTARQHHLCRTPTGRIIKFDSAMKMFKIRQPTSEEMDNFWAYRRLKKEVDEMLKRGMREEAKALERQSVALWSDPESGVKNASEYNRFLGKIERVSINIPLQGTAGDLMRSALNRIRVWVLANPGMEKIFRLHLTVHDEIDFSVKNEFVPYVLPRINRLMKLRPLHKTKGWVVPIETDCEYGQTWDVQHHLTGDDGHKAAAWMDIAGLESYVPDDFDPEIVDTIVAAWDRGEHDRVLGWLQKLHPRVQAYITKGKDQYLGDPSSENIRRIVTTMIQLHEFWVVDENEEDNLLLADWADQVGLEIPNEPLVGGLDGYLASIPVEDVEVSDVSPMTLVPVPDATEELKEAMQEALTMVGLKPSPEPQEAPEATPEAPAAPEATPEEDPFYEPPRKPVEATPEDDIPVLRDLDDFELPKFRMQLGLGFGPYAVKFRWVGDNRIRTLPTSQLPTIPKEWLA